MTHEVLTPEEGTLLPSSGHFRAGLILGLMWSVAAAVWIVWTIPTAVATWPETRATYWTFMDWLAQSLHMTL